MSRKLVFVLSLLTLLSSLLYMRFNKVEAKTSNGYAVHNIDTGINYTTIQEAINAPETKGGHTIRVDAGTYFEHVTITKSISLIGENRDTTIVDGNGTGTVIGINTNNVSVINLTVTNAGRIWGPPPCYGYPDTCILGSNVRNIRIENNTFTGAAVCVAFIYSRFIDVRNNAVSNATYIGVLGYASHNVTISRNLVSDYGSEGIHLDGGSAYCKIVNNTVKNGLAGISLEKPATARNLIEGNNLLDNNASIGLYGCGVNVFRRNNMTSSQYNLLIWGYSLTSFMQDIDDSNIVNNKILYYLTNRHNLLIDPSNYPNLGYLAIINCTNTVMRDFNITHNGDGILLARSTNCTLTNITISDNRGPLIYGGLMFFESNNNKIVNSKITNNSYGICLYHSDWNIFYHNSLSHNNRQVVSDFLSPFQNKSSGYFSVNIWDDGYPSGGNYWSDYNGTDLYDGMYQNETGSDGISDTHYIVDVNNVDRFPLMGMFYDFNVTWLEEIYQMDIISNSEVSGFEIVEIVNLETEELWAGIHFYVSGKEGTLGFCKIRIPTALMNRTYNVFVNNTEVSYTVLPFLDDTYRYLYFTYSHSTQEVLIIPEFPYSIALPLFMATALLVNIIQKKNKNNFNSLLAD